MAYPPSRETKPKAPPSGVQVASWWNPRHLAKAKPFWDKIADLADQLHGEGATGAEIFEETKKLTPPTEFGGLVRLGDANWGVEGSDAGFKLRDEFARMSTKMPVKEMNRRFGDVFEAPLTERYAPEIMEVPTDFQIVPKAGRGGDRPGGGYTQRGAVDKHGRIDIRHDPDLPVGDRIDRFGAIKLGAHEGLGHGVADVNQLAVGDAASGLAGTSYLSLVTPLLRDFQKNIAKQILAHPGGEAQWALENPDAARLYYHAKTVAPLTSKRNKTRPPTQFDYYQYGTEGEDQANRVAENIDKTAEQIRAEGLPSQTQEGGWDPLFRLFRHDATSSNYRRHVDLKPTLEDYMKKKPITLAANPGGSKQGRYRKGSKLSAVAGAGAGGAAMTADPSEAATTEKTDRLPHSTPKTDRLPFEPAPRDRFSSGRPYDPAEFAPWTWEGLAKTGASTLTDVAEGTVGFTGDMLSYLPDSMRQALARVMTKGMMRDIRSPTTEQVKAFTEPYVSQEWQRHHPTNPFENALSFGVENTADPMSLVPAAKSIKYLRRF